jgi:dihydroorotate dehydrogenase
MSTSELQRLGLELPTDRPPIFVSAGVVKENPYDHVKYSSMPEIAALVIGSFSEKENKVDHQGKPTFLYDSKNWAAYNSVKLANCGHEFADRFVRHGISLAQDAGQLAIVGITALQHEDPRQTVPKLVHWARQTGANGVEINGSCPNEDHEGLLCEDVEASLEVVSLARELIGPDFYIIYKVSSLPAEKIRALHAGGLAVNAISAINSLRQPLELTSTTSPKPAQEVENQYRGYSQSGPIILGVARYNLALWFSETAGYDIWSVGGIDNGYEAYHRIMSGALLAGGAQAFVRDVRPETVAARWAEEYPTGDQPVA